MFPVGNDFYCHVVYQVNAFNRTFVFILMVFVETGHGIVEMGCVSESHFIGCAHVVIVCLRVRNAWKNSVLHTCAPEFHCSGKFRGFVPAFNAVCRVEQGTIVHGRGIFYVFG